MSSSIKAVLDLDLSRFSASAKQAPKVLSDAMDVAGKTAGAQFGQAVGKKLGSKDAFKSFVGALALDVQSISNKIAETVTGGAQASWQKAAETADRITSAINARYEARLDTAGKIANIEREIARDTKDIDASPRSKIPWLTALTPILSVIPGVRDAIAQMRNAGGMPGMETDAEALERSQEAQARIAEKRLRMEALETQKIDEARAARNRRAEIEMSRKRGGPTSDDRLDEITRQRLDIIQEMEAKGTSQARQQQLQVDLDRLDLQYIREVNTELDKGRATRDAIREIERESAAIGETRAEHFARLQERIRDLLQKSADITRGEDERRQLRVRAAQAMAEAAKFEYDWKIKTASLDSSSKTESGRRSTTVQGTRARQAINFRAQADRARSQGRYDDAVRFGELADSYEQDFNQADRRGMLGAYRRRPALDPKAMQTRAARSERSAPPGTDLGPGLTTANQHLKSIDESLKPVDVNQS